MLFSRVNTNCPSLVYTLANRSLHSSANALTVSYAHLRANITGQCQHNRIHVGVNHRIHRITPAINTKGVTDISTHLNQSLNSSQHSRIQHNTYRQQYHTSDPIANHRIGRHTCANQPHRDTDTYTSHNKYTLLANRIKPAYKSGSYTTTVARPGVMQDYLKSDRHNIIGFIIFVKIIC